TQEHNMRSSMFEQSILVLTIMCLNSCLMLPDDTMEAEDSQDVAHGNIPPSALSDCDAGFLCLWVDQGFGGRHVQFQDSGCQNLSQFSFNDMASSWWNRNGNNYRIYRNANCDDLMFVAQSSAQVSNLAGSGTNDQASSICRPPANVGGPCP